MSCYIRHLDEFFADLGIENTKENRKMMDIAIKKSLGMEVSKCPEVWKELKIILASEEETRILLTEVAKEMAV